MSYIGNSPEFWNLNVNKYSYTATEGQTIFNAVYDAEVDVYLNGSKLQKNVDFTATDGVSVVLTLPAVLNDVVDINGYFNMEFFDLSKYSGSGLGLDADLLDGQHGSYYTANTLFAAHTANTSNPHIVTKTQVGLGSVDNTADVNKPISTATQTALNLKADKSIVISAGSGLVGGGDLSASRTISLASSGATANTYGSSSAIPVLSIDTYGRVTSANTVAVNIPSGALTFTGDVTGSGSTGSTTTLILASSGVTAGTYKSVTVDAKGRVTGGTNPTTLAGYGITDAAASTHTHVLSLTDVPDAWVKKSVRVATTANITLSAPQTIDGIAVVAGDRVLVKDQTAQATNGIYVVQAATWTRATDADTISELSGACVNVDSGIVNGGFRFDTDLKLTDVLGTTAVVFAKVFDTTDSASTNTANKLVLRDASGNFSAGIITATLSGNATTATTATNLSGGTVSTTSLKSTSGIVENNATITSNYTITDGNNAMSAGPVSVSSGVTVTVPTGSTWTIV